MGALFKANRIYYVVCAYSGLDLANPQMYLFPLCTHSCHTEYLITSTECGRVGLSSLHVHSACVCVCVCVNMRNVACG